MKGIFTISLDFELHWGGFEKWPIENYRQYFLNTRAVIPKMLALFEEYDVHVTWATVGLLFHHDRSEVQRNYPAGKPDYTMQELSAYHYIQKKGIGDNEESDPFHYAPTLIKKILATPHQEIGSHTFAHYYCSEPGQTVDTFREDLRAAKNAATPFGIQLKSLVFPRNQFNDSYLKVCFEEGITSVRSNPSDWFWHIESTQRESRWKRFNRGLDAYIPIGKKSTYRLQEVVQDPAKPACFPASRLLRPYSPNQYLEKLKINRIKKEMMQAARDGEVYHLWWHPHNFGHHPDENIHTLQQILSIYRTAKNEYDMQSLTMNEAATALQKMTTGSPAIESHVHDR